MFIKRQCKEECEENNDQKFIPNHKSKKGYLLKMLEKLKLIFLCAAI